MGSASPFPLVQIQLALPVRIIRGLRDREQGGAQGGACTDLIGLMDGRMSPNIPPPSPHTHSLTLSVPLSCSDVWQRAMDQREKDKGSPAHVSTPGTATHNQ